MYLWLILRRPFPSTFIHLFFNLSCLQNAWPEIRPRRLGNTPPPWSSRSGADGQLPSPPPHCAPFSIPARRFCHTGQGVRDRTRGGRVPCSGGNGAASEMRSQPRLRGGGLRGAPSCPQQTRPCRHGEGGRSRTGGQQVSARSRPTGPVDCPRSGAGCTPSWSP